MRGIEYLESLPQWRQGAFSQIDVPRKILAALGNPQDKIKTIHVAGTNGKGTTCAAIASILKQAGRKTGFFSSPHLVDLTERCRINGQAISREKFDYYLSKVAEVVAWDTEAMTYFVATTAACFLYFVEEKVDFAVIEVGLGGKFDATNLIAKPELTIITGVDFDHVDVLGPGILDIAENKAGIIKENVPVILGEISEQLAKQVILEIAKEKKAEVFYLEENSFFIDNELMRSVVGQHAARIAIKAARILNLSEQSIESGLNNLYWPGRMDYFVLNSNKSVLIDGAHNVAGVKVLFSHLAEMLERKGIKQVSLLFGLKQRAGDEQTAEEVKRSIAELSKKGFLVNLHLVKWEQGLVNLNSFFDTDYEQELIPGLINSLAGPDGIVVVFGSLYLIGEVLSFFNKELVL